MFLNENTGSLMVLLTLVYVVCTMVMVRLLMNQAWETNRGYVAVRLTFHQQMLLTLEVANQGKSAARRLKLSLDRDIYEAFDSKEKKLNDMPLFSDTIETMPAGDRYFLYLWPGTVKLGGEKFPREFKVTAAYETLGRRIVEETTLHPVLLYQFVPMTVEESLERAVKALQETRAIQEKIVSRFDQFLRSGEQQKPGGSRS